MTPPAYGNAGTAVKSRIPFARAFAQLRSIARFKPGT